MKILKFAGALAGLVLCLSGPVIAAESDPIIGQWIDKLPDGNAMIVEFTVDKISFTGVTVEGSHVPSSVFPVRYKKEGDGKCVVSKASKKKGDSILDKTHPPVAERIANIDIAIDKLDAKQITSATGQERFARAQSRMPKEKVKK